MFKKRRKVRVFTEDEVEAKVHRELSRARYLRSTPSPTCSAVRAATT